MGLAMTSKNLLSRESGSAFKERRSFIGAMATLGAGLAGSVILPETGLAQPTPEAHKKTKSAASVCGHSTVIASDAATVAETTAGKSLDSDGTAYTFSKVYPTARQPLAPGASCRQSSLNRGRDSHDRGGNFKSSGNTDSCFCAVTHR